MAMASSSSDPGLKSEAGGGCGGGGSSGEAAMVAKDELFVYRGGLKKAKKERGCTAKERISKMPPCAAGKRSSIYRGVTRYSLSLSLSQRKFSFFLRVHVDVDVNFLNFQIKGIDGLVDMKLIFGTKALGIKIRIRKENKVSLSLYLSLALYLGKILLHTRNCTL